MQGGGCRCHMVLCRRGERHGGAARRLAKKEVDGERDAMGQGRPGGDYTRRK
jgi:hypothetical protein